MVSALIIHGGAGKWTNIRPEVTRTLKEASLEGFRALKTQGSVKAVVTGIRYLEKSGLFNAGCGGILNIEGKRELDAGIMDGQGLRVGCVGAVTDALNPIELAYGVLRHTDHVLIVGKGATNYEKRAGALKGEADIMPAESADTVGAVAIDDNWHVAAGASTGGVLNKLQGRVGDSAIAGAGLYADDALGAVTFSGIGEQTMRTAAAFRAVQLMEKVDPLNSLRVTMDEVKKKLTACNLGAIAINSQGRVAVYHRTSFMPACIITDKMTEPLFQAKWKSGYLI